MSDGGACEEAEGELDESSMLSGLLPGILVEQEHDGQAFRSCPPAAFSVVDLRSQCFPENTGRSKKAQYL